MQYAKITPKNTNINTENCKNYSSKCAYDCAQLQYTLQHRTALIISPLICRLRLGHGLEPSELELGLGLVHGAL